MLFESFTRGPRGFPYVFIITGKVTALEPVYGPTFVDHGVFVLWGYQKAFDGAITFEVGLYTIPPTYLFNAFTETLGVRYYYMTLDFNFIGNKLGTCGALAFSPTSDFTERPGKSFLHLFRVFAISKCFPEILLFFLKPLRVATDSLGQPLRTHIRHSISVLPQT